MAARVTSLDSGRPRLAGRSKRSRRCARSRRVRADLLPIVPRAIAGDDVVVLVHGFLATAGVFRPLRARLEREAGRAGGELQPRAGARGSAHRAAARAPRRADPARDADSPRRAQPRGDRGALVRAGDGRARARGADDFDRDAVRRRADRRAARALRRQRPPRRERRPHAPPRRSARSNATCPTSSIAGTEDRMVSPPECAALRARRARRPARGAGTTSSSSTARRSISSWGVSSARGYVARTFVRSRRGNA